MRYTNTIRCFRRSGYFFFGGMSVILFGIVPPVLTKLLDLRDAGILYFIFDVLLITFLLTGYRSDKIRGLFTYEVTAEYHERYVVIKGKGRPKEIRYAEVKSAELLPYKTELVIIRDTGVPELSYGHWLRVKTDERYFELWSAMEEHVPRQIQLGGVKLFGTKVLSLIPPGKALPVRENRDELEITVLWEALKTNGQSIIREKYQEH